MREVVSGEEIVHARVFAEDNKQRDISYLLQRATTIKVTDTEIWEVVARSLVLV